MMMYNDTYYSQQQEEAPQMITNAVTCSYNEPIDQEQQYYSQEHQENWDMMELENEEECYAQYDLNMANALAEADYQDCYYEQQEQQQYCQDYNEHEYEEEEQEEYCDDDYYYQPQQPSYDYQNDSLLSLVVGVQSYLTEQADWKSSSAKHDDSPLYNLQYKMYTYMRQRALELGVQL